MNYHANGAQTGGYWLLWSAGTMSEQVDWINTGSNIDGFVKSPKRANLQI